MIDKIVQHIYSLIEVKIPVVIAIDGKSASGKTIIALDIKKLTDCAVIHTDDFFLPKSKKTSERLAVPGGNIDSERMTEEVFKNIVHKKEFRYCPYSCAKDTFLKPLTVPFSKIYIIEGVYSMHPLFEKYYDFAVFLNINPEEQLKRILKRDGKTKLELYKNIWIPLEELYFNEYNIEKRCLYVKTQ